MQPVVSAIITFPNIFWGAMVNEASALQLDEAEHYQKMTYRNRYYIAGANGVLALSVPLVHDRNQRSTMKDIRISNADAWQVQHWRSLTSAYRRSPYFTHYEEALRPLFDKQYIFLADFNTASIHWIKQQLDIKQETSVVTTYERIHEQAIDLRTMKPSLEKAHNKNFPAYYQVFDERTGFLPNLSLLDLLFAEGPYAMSWINKHSAAIKQAVTKT